MKLEDIEVGQTVVDEFGNEYVVEIVSNVSNDLMPVYLICTEIVKPVDVQKHGVMFECEDDHFWIYKSKEVAKKDGIEKCITVESLKLKE